MVFAEEWSPSSIGGIALAIERQSRQSVPEAVESPDFQFGQFIYGERRTVVALGLLASEWLSKEVQAWSDIACGRKQKAKDRDLMDGSTVGRKVCGGAVKSEAFVGVCELLCLTRWKLSA